MSDVGWHGKLGSVLESWKIPTTQPSDKVVRIRETLLDAIAAEIRAAQADMVNIQAEYHKLALSFEECSERLTTARQTMAERMAELGILAKPIEGQSGN